MKKLLSILLIMSLLVACIPLAASAAPTATVEFDKTKTYKAGDKVTLTVTSSDATYCYAYTYSKLPDGRETDHNYVSSSFTAGKATLDMPVWAGTNYFRVSVRDVNYDYTYVTTDKIEVQASATVAAPTVTIKDEAHTVMNKVSFSVKNNQTAGCNVYYVLYKGSLKCDNDYDWIDSNDTENESFSSSSLSGPGEYTVKSFAVYDGNISSVTEAKFNVTAAALKAPTINVTDEKKLYSGQPLRVRFAKNSEDDWVSSNSVVASYTVTRDADGADVTVIPKMNAITRFSQFNSEMIITSALSAGTYTIKAKLVDTNKWYTDSPETTKQVTVLPAVKPTVTLNSTDYYESEYDGNKHYNYKLGESLTATINAPGRSSCVVEYFDTETQKTETKTIALTNGVGTLSLPAFTKGTYYSNSSFAIVSADAETFSDVRAYYEVKLAAPVTVTTDKDAYLIGETAKVTITGADADYYEVEMEFTEKYKSRERDIINGVHYNAAGGSVTIDVPLTEAGWFNVYTQSVNEAKRASSYGESVNVQVDTAENIGKGDYPAPTGQKVTIESNTSLKFSWKASEGAKRYDVYRAYGEESFKRIATVEDTFYVDEEVEAKKIVHYQVRARGNTGSSDLSGIASYELLPQVTGLKAKNDKSKTLSVSWKKAKDADYYEIYYATKKAAPTVSTKASMTVQTGVKAEITKKIKTKKTYYVYVRAVRKIGDTKIVGPWSKVKKVKVSK